MGIHQLATVCKKKTLIYDGYFHNEHEGLELCATCKAKFGEKKDLDEHVSNIHDGKM